MAFRRTFHDKLKFLKRAGLEQTKENVALVNKLSRKNRGKL